MVVRFLPRSTQLDKIKNLGVEVQAGPVAKSQSFSVRQYRPRTGWAGSLGRRWSKQVVAEGQNGASLSREVRGGQATRLSASAGAGAVAPYLAGVSPPGADGDELPGRMPGLTRKPQFPSPHPVPSLPSAGES